MVKPLIVTFRPTAVSKTRLASLLLTASLFAPGPLIVTLRVISNSPLVSVMVSCNPAAKSISLGPGAAMLAAATAARKEPAPLSLRFLTRNGRAGCDLPVPQAAGGSADG